MCRHWSQSRPRSIQLASPVWSSGGLIHLDRELISSQGAQVLAGRAAKINLKGCCHAMDVATDVAMPLTLLEHADVLVAVLRLVGLKDKRTLVVVKLTAEHVAEADAHLTWFSAVLCLHLEQTFLEYIYISLQHGHPELSLQRCNQPLDGSDTNIGSAASCADSEFVPIKGMRNLLQVIILLIGQ